MEFILGSTTSRTAPVASTRDVLPLTAAISIKRPTECMVCMEAPRKIRFACGHLACCEKCTADLIATADNRVPQNACPMCRAEIIVWEQLGEDDDAFTYRQPAGPVPGPIKTKPPRPPDPARSPDAVALDQEPFVLLFPESGSVGISLARPWRGPQGLMHSVRDVSFGSPADDLGCPTGGVILHVNGVSVIGMSRAEVLQRTQERPLRIVMRLPLAGEWPIPDPPNQPPLRATVIPKGCWDVQYTVTLPPSVVAGETLIVAMPPKYTVHVAFVVPRTVAPGAQLLLKVAPEDLRKLRKSRGRLALIAMNIIQARRTVRYSIATTPTV